jgi:hypothetical protein
MRYCVKYRGSIISSRDGSSRTAGNKTGNSLRRGASPAQRPEHNLHLRLMRTRTVIAALVSLVAITAAGLLRIWWASGQPRLPIGWSASSVWLQGYRPPLALWPQGVWVDCWLDTGKNVDRCKFADYSGKIWNEDDYTTCDGQPAVSNDRLVLRNHQDFLWALRLKDGTTLIAATVCNARGTNPPTHLTPP